MADDLDLHALVRAAEAAEKVAPGPWSRDDDWTYEVHDANGAIAASCPRAGDAKWDKRAAADFIAAANPQAVLAMARRIEELEAYRARCITQAVDALPPGTAIVRNDRLQELLELESDVVPTLRHAHDSAVAAFEREQKCAEQAEQRALDAERLAVALADALNKKRDVLEHMGFWQSGDEADDLREQVYAIRARLAGKEGAK